MYTTQYKKETGRYGCGDITTEREFGVNGPQKASHVIPWITRVATIERQIRAGHSC